MFSLSVEIAVTRLPIRLLAVVRLCCVCSDCSVLVSWSEAAMERSSPICCTSWVLSMGLSGSWFVSSADHELQELVDIQVFQVVDLVFGRRA